ncbi:nucleoside triphosphate pyrophosphohydrolase [Streptomyces paromomycinus]|uniref:Nucleoside triphosphate pyrophosphohydrolase n=1 Tax=Streptomyces paromomycinus TaxID=92743 RepID=A0A401W7G6_STREY|nr:nucleoside triphosphate pyrophosphohydrolase [Streptomyces paromomycinus]
MRYVRRVNADATDAPGTPQAPAPGRLVLLTTSHRVAPGLLSWPAWQTLRGADLVLCADAAHPQLPYLREAGVVVGTDVPGARELVEFCRAGDRTAVVITSADGDSELTDGLARMAGSGRETMPDLELLPGSYDLPGARLLDLVQVMDQIRRGCPWSGVRTHQDLAKYGIEEMYELVEAIEEGDREAVREELGDVLLQVVFHARIAQDDPDEPFSVDDVAGTIVEKLIHRHPHLFGEDEAHTPEDVKAHWARTKAAEKRRASVTEGIPLGQPALALAGKLASRARASGIDALPAGEGIGYELLALAVRAEAAGTDPETALRAAARTYRDAIRSAEEAASGAAD